MERAGEQTKILETALAKNTKLLENVKRELDSMSIGDLR